jgi:hypothetical protein
LSKITLTLVPDGVRRCGGCTLCCKLLPMGMGPMPRPDEFKKPAGERCPHQRTGKGCAIYQKRPECCRVWNCRWLGDPEGTAGLRRPDRTHYVLDIMPDCITLRDPIEHGGQEATVEVIQVWVDPHHRDAYKDPALLGYLAKLGEQGIAALIRYSSSAGFVLFPPAMTQTGDWHEEHGGQVMPEQRPDERLAGLANAQRVTVPGSTRI